MNNIESLKSYFSSEIVLILGLVVLIFLSLRRGHSDHKSMSPASSVVSVVTLFLAITAALSVNFTESQPLFHGMIALDPFGQFFKILIMGTTLVTVVFCTCSRDLENTPGPEFMAFLMALCLGLNVMCVSNNMLMMYLAVEMASLVSYIMAGYMTENKRSEEAGLKYVLYGGLASGVMIFGMSLLYGLTGSLDLVSIRQVVINNPPDQLILFLTFIMILTGLGYKMAIAPFHMWSPDVYEGAPLPVTAFLSVASKAAGFALTLRFLFVAFVATEVEGTWSAVSAIDWQMLVAVLSAVTMTVGNVLALQQLNIKRFLAYSSIAHAGYMLMAVAAQSGGGLEGVVFYFMVYFLMNLGAFLVAGVILNQRHTEDMRDYKGLVRQGASGLFLALTLSVFLFSLTGIPPFAGFIGKWYVFKAVINAGLLWLAVIGALNSVISLYFYVRLIKFMLVDSAEKNDTIERVPLRFASLISIFAALTLVFGLYFAPLVKWTQASVVMFR
ncbi:MAG: NADH-quinone oxidoreductase subunit N [Deltaproteobacteria bacterium]|nr:NADH-quinone oxidoreductase subunit N [Deltaproteobacteria bacterium]